ncbi:MAG TPA: hypothetical protein VMT51_11395 [Dongiaceae bacterium]|nr:hypothetical protein [Dongiaceae bacterium]
MSKTTVLGLILCVVGIIGLLHPTFTYHKTEEVARIGSLHADVNREKHAFVPTALCAVLIVVGAGVAVMGGRGKS